MDVDGDGFVDFAVYSGGNLAGADLTLYHGSASGFVATDLLHLSEETVQSGGAIYQDMDGDGSADVLVWNGHSDTISWFASDGAGGFPESWSVIPEVNHDQAATAADLDGDGAPEIVAATYDSARVYWNDGARILTEGGEATVDLSSWFNDTRIWPGGVELDGTPGEEAIATTSDGATFAVLDGDGRGFTATAYAGPEVDVDTTFQHAADLDGDGDDELLIENAAVNRGDMDGDGVIDDEVKILIGGLGEAGFPTAWTDLVFSLGPDPVLALTMDADLDGDGLVDLAIVDAAGVRLWGWDGAALVERVSTDLIWGGGSADYTARAWLASTDADGDGDIDLLIALRGLASVQVLENDGAGAFTAGAIVAVPASLEEAAYAALADLSGDGHLDAWTLDGDDGVVRSWRETEAGWETLLLQTIGILNHGTARDIDGDGVADLVGAGGRQLWVYWGTGKEVPCE
jgi:hypothetical protein